MNKIGFGLHFSFAAFGELCEMFSLCERHFCLPGFQGPLRLYENEPPLWDRHQATQAISLGLKPAPPRSDLNLKEVQLLWPGWPDLSPHSLFETLAEVDFYSYRPRDLTLQASQAASLSRGAGSQYHGQKKMRSSDEELLRSNI